ncbi:MAG: acyl-CoA thioesterase [Bacteriovoracaceae bacterium]
MENAQTFSYQLQIKEQHLDSFGHVNNAVYLELYEEARWDFITQNGFGLKHIQETQKGPVVLEVNVKYKRELKNRETITITSKTVEIKGKIMNLYQEIIKQDGKVASVATFTVGFMDLRERALINPDPSWLKAIGIGSI